MREITTHRVKPDEPLRIFALGEPGPGGAHRLYGFIGPAMGAGPRFTQAEDRDLIQADSLGPNTGIQFQVGNPAYGCNGLTIEALLAICADKLEGHQSSQFACAENATALTNIKAALATLKGRTQRRMAQGVEGTQAPDLPPAGLTQGELHQRVALHMGELIRLRPSLSYNDSYMGEPAGQLKFDVTEWERSMRGKRVTMPAAAPLFSGYMTTQPPVAPLDLGSDAPLTGACDLSGDGPCESCT